MTFTPFGIYPNTHNINFININVLLFICKDERIGNLTCILKSRELVPAVKSQFTLLVRGMYSNPPAFGARIVSTILNNPQYFAEWYVNSSLITH